MPVLIRVPALPDARRRPSRARPARRRRLRREVRLAGWALLAGMSLAGTWLYASSHRRSSAAEEPAPPVVSLSLEGPAPAPPRAVPVVLDAIIVTDEGIEEAGHAGS